jgi:hypothetical protein
MSETDQALLELNREMIIGRMERLKELLGDPTHILAQVQVQPLRQTVQGGKTIEAFQVLFAFLDLSKTNLILPDGEKLRDAKIFAIPFVKGCSVADFSIVMQAYGEAIEKQVVVEAENESDESSD